jgi:hypothetical protein
LCNCCVSRVFSLSCSAVTGFFLFCRSSSSLVVNNNKNTYPQHAVAFLFDDVLLSRRSEGKEGSEEEHENTLDGSHGDSFCLFLVLVLLFAIAFCAALQNCEPEPVQCSFLFEMRCCAAQARQGWLRLASTRKKNRKNKLKGL